MGSPRPRPRELEPGCPGRGALGRRPGAPAVPGWVGAGCSATNLGAAAASQRPGGSFRWREASAQAAETGEGRPGAGSCSRSRLSEAASGAGRTLPGWGNSPRGGIHGVAGSVFPPKTGLPFSFSPREFLARVWDSKCSQTKRTRTWDLNPHPVPCLPAIPRGVGRAAAKPKS